MIVTVHSPEDAGLLLIRLCEQLMVRQGGPETFAVCAESNEILRRAFSVVEVWVRRTGYDPKHLYCWTDNDLLGLRAKNTSVYFCAKPADSFFKPPPALIIDIRLSA